MLKKELLELIANAENSLVESKRDDIRSEQLANTYSGRIILGIEDNGDIYGIRSKIIPIMREFNGTEPEFETSEDFLKTTLYNNGAINDPNEPNIIQNDPNLDPNEPNLDPNLSLKEQILAILQRNPQATYNEMAQLSGKSMASIKRALAMLKKQGYIHRQGSTRSGSWQLLQGVSLEQSNKSSY